jgi:PAB1-binding protein PBP1
MKKQNIRAEVPFYFSWTYGVSIKKIREDLDEVEKLGATDINIEIDNWDRDSIEIKAFAVRLETDEEYKERIDKYKKNLKLQEARELQQLEMLKKKYPQHLK